MPWPRAGGRLARARLPESRKNYAGTSPLTRASGTRRTILPATPSTADSPTRRRNAQRAFCSRRGSPGARRYYQALRSRGIGHQAALRQLSNRFVGNLHGRLKTGTAYSEHTRLEPPRPDRLRWSERSARERPAPSFHLGRSAPSVTSRTRNGPAHRELASRTQRGRHPSSVRSSAPESRKNATVRMFPGNVGSVTSRPYSSLK